MISYDNHIINAIKLNITNSKHVSKYFNFTYTSQKHKIECILAEILKVIKYGIPWRLIENIPYTTVYTSYKRLLHFGILRNTYIDLLHLYLKKQPNRKLKYQYTDTTCISNKYGSKHVAYNGYKKKKCSKISFVSEAQGIPINASIHNGKQNDGKILVSHFHDILINKKLNNKNKKYMLADSIYYVNEVKNLLSNEGYEYIINPNRKNTKYKEIEKLTPKQIKIYAKRIKIEHTNSILKTYRRLNCRYDRNLDTFYGSLWFALIGIIIRKI